MPAVKFNLCSTDIGATRSYATPYKTITPGTVLPNFSLDASREYRRSYVHPRDRKISIDNVPTMLLPKARIREDFDLSELRDLVFPDNSLQKVHLAALHPNGIYGNSADQKRIWFEDISNTSGSISNEDGECDSLLSYLSSTSSDDRHRENIPQHLESFGTTLPEVNVKSRKPLRGLSAPDEHDDHRRCSSCNQLNEARERVLTYFGGVEYFLSWVLSKWRKVSCNCNSCLLKSINVWFASSLSFFLL
ncbi:hypothetical protein SNE40_003797 [Patella caerulea]|uniref:Uncharacterized protein n=1 Tax=Patella caerulea TaxID=87958 RepID=A0AAN8K3P7_PATCE